jgi:tetratricopeptide (TPR) repeat protein
VLASLSVRPEYAAVEAACRVTESLGASQAMDPARAQRAAERALALEERRGGIRAIRSDALSALASAYKNASQFDDANRVNEQLVALYEAEGRENTRDMTTVLNNWAVMLGDAGQMLHAASVAGRAVDIARTLDSEHGASLTLLTNDAAALAAVGRNDEANRLFDEALAKGRVAGSPRRHVATLSLAINAACEAGDSSRAERLLSESYATLKADPSASTYMKGVVDMDAAAVALTRGALPRAVELASGALTTLEAATPNKASAGAAEQTLAHALNAAGRYREALPIAERRASTARSRLGGYRYSYRLGKALVEEAYARAGLGDAAVAGNTVAAAIEHLSATAGPESRALQRAMALQRQLSGQ